MRSHHMRTLYLQHYFRHFYIFTILNSTFFYSLMCYFMKIYSFLKVIYLFTIFLRVTMQKTQQKADSSNRTIRFFLW